MTTTDWTKVPWTPFERCEIPTGGVHDVDPPDLLLINSRYQVAVYVRGNLEPFGPIVHLSFKVHDRQAHHDWRDIQRLKNEICGDECDAVEIYPAESKLVDGANQYHLFVFGTYKIPFGFQERLVSDEGWEKSQQRPWPEGERPPDCLSRETMERRVAMHLQARKEAGQ